MGSGRRDDGTDTGRIRERLVAASPLTERSQRLAGVSTAILEGGDGPPMVLLHGQGEFWGVWLLVLDELVATHRVVVADLPGHGASMPVDGPLDADHVVRWTDALIGATCPAPPVLVGHLLGGAVAARYATAHGDRLAHLVLVDSLGLAWYRPALRFAIPLIGFMARPTPRSRDRLFDKCFLDFDRVGERFGDHWDDLRDYALDRARTADNQAALRALMPRVGVPPVGADELDRIGTPTTLVHGRHDLQVPLEVAERASTRHGWPLHVVDGAADDPAVEQPGELVEVLRRLPARRRGPARREAS